jgi:hypothetical protein
MDAQLADSRSHLFGREPVLADFCVYHPLWFLLRALPQSLQRYEHVTAWMSRMAALGHGVSSELSGADAIGIARQAQPMGITAFSDDEAFKTGERVEVMPTDYGLDPVAGELILCNADEIAIRRVDAQVGEVIVHFPRLSYQIRSVTDRPS